MRIKIEFDGQTYYRNCSEAYRWTGVIRDAPDWLTDYIAEDMAIIAKADRALLFINLRNGWPRANVGDIVIQDGENIDVIRRTEP